LLLSLLGRDCVRFCRDRLMFADRSESAMAAS
jgi:hypothetical protein